MRIIMLNQETAQKTFVCDEIQEQQQMRQQLYDLMRSNELTEEHIIEFKNKRGNLNVRTYQILLGLVYKPIYLQLFLDNGFDPSQSELFKILLNEYLSKYITFNHTLYVMRMIIDKIDIDFMDDSITMERPILCDIVYKYNKDNVNINDLIFIIDNLRVRGANLNIKDSWNNTPMMCNNLLLN